MTKQRRKEPVRLSWLDIAALIEAIKQAEKIKPSQQAKRDVFKKYGILGTVKDPPLTAIFYRVMKRQGIIDKVITEVTGAKSPLFLDENLRATLRLFIELEIFSKNEIRYERFSEIRNRVSSYLSKNVHPYVGMWFWELIDKLENYRIEPKNESEELMFKYMLPSWYIDRIVNLIGMDEAEKLLKVFNSRPLISIRVNTLKATVDEVIEALKNEGKRDLEVSRVVPTVIRFKGPYNFDKSKLFKEGKIVIQEEAAALASLILDPKPGDIVVDLCAAPGGKTEHIAELMRNKGVIHAFDIDELRVKRMQELLKRAGISIVKIYLRDGREAPRILGECIADKVLVDPPCSSDGTLMKNPDLRWRLVESEVPKIAQLQYELLKAAIKLVKVGGRILYTTCTLLKEQNEDVIAKILKKEGKRVKLVPIKGPYDPGFMDGTMRAWPHKHRTIGFFYALLEKVKE